MKEKQGLEFSSNVADLNNERQEHLYASHIGMNTVFRKIRNLCCVSKYRTTLALSFFMS